MTILLSKRHWIVSKQCASTNFVVRGEYTSNYYRARTQIEPLYHKFNHCCGRQCWVCRHFTLPHQWLNSGPSGQICISHGSWQMDNIWMCIDCLWSISATSFDNLLILDRMEVYSPLFWTRSTWYTFKKVPISNTARHHNYFTDLRQLKAHTLLLSISCRSVFYSLKHALELNNLYIL